ncbi:MAG TPA: alpha-amylase family glycosyl hydrolase [Saprospiraceae bacterium]
MIKQVELWKRMATSFVVIFMLAMIVAGCGKESDPPKPPDGPDPYEQYGTPFQDIPALDEMVMYEVNLRAFSVNGDLDGVRARLDEIKALGVNVIWLMPIHPIGTVNSVNSPYSVKDFKAVGAEYGTLNDLRALTDEAHAKGIAVMMDWIANHTSWDNAWITHPTWYTQDGSGNIIHPPGTNWLDVADLDFDNSTMRKTMIDAMKYWVLEANVDGFRCDYADGVPFDFWKQAIDSLNAVPNRDLIFLAEGDRPDHFQAGFDLNFSWEFYGKLINAFDGQSANALYTTHVSEYQNVPVGKQKLRFTTNHDESAWNNSPVVIFHGKQGALAASVASIFIGGVPLLYSGQEVGRATTTPFFTKSPISWNENPDMLQAYKDIMGFYGQSDVARKGTIEDYSTNEAVVLTKTLGEDAFLLIVNTRNATVGISIPVEISNLNWTNALTNDTLQFGANVQLTNYQYILAKR